MGMVLFCSHLVQHALSVGPAIEAVHLKIDAEILVEIIIKPYREGFSGNFFVCHNFSPLKSFKYLMLSSCCYSMAFSLPSQSSKMCRLLEKQQIQRECWIFADKLRLAIVFKQALYRE